MKKKIFCGEPRGITPPKILVLLFTVSIALSMTFCPIPVQAQAAPVTVSVDPKGSFLYLDGVDSPYARNPTIVDLTAYGFAPSNKLKLTYQGWFCYTGTPPECQIKLEKFYVIGVFSSSNILLAPSSLHRVPDAIDAGVDVPTPETYTGKVDTDIPEDFRIFPPDNFIIQIPADATHLFLGISDSAYRDNSGEISVTIELVVRPVALFSNVLWIFPVAVLAGVFVRLRRRRKHPPTT